MLSSVGNRDNLGIKFLFSSSGRSPGRAVVLPPALVLVLATGCLNEIVLISSACLNVYNIL